MKIQTEQELLEQLLALSDHAYRDFQSALVPNIPKEAILGVRTPLLRKFAKEFSKSDSAAAFMDALPHRYYDENNLHAFLIERIGDFEKTKDALERFLPYVNNWATCDAIAPKIFSKYPAERVQMAKAWLASSHTYTVRYGIVLLMKYDLAETFRPEYADLVASVSSDDYYVRMAQAWYFATALVSHEDVILPYLTEKRLDPWIHNKIIQKAVESFRIPKDRKEYLKTLRSRKTPRKGSV